MKLAKVKWLDANSVSEIIHISEIKSKCKPSEVVSIGYLIKKRGFIILAATLYDDSISDVIVIPKNWVLEIKELVVK